MLPLQKQKSEPTAPLSQPWHPNFRNYDRLPDIKVVRTAFFVNMAAISVVVSVLAFVCFREYQLNSLQQQIANATAQIDKDTAASDQAVKLYREFQAIEVKVQELELFVKSKPLLSPVLINVAQNLPANVALVNLDVGDKTMTLRGVIRGASDYASGIGISYQNQLKKDPFVSKHFEDVVIRNMVRSGTNNRISFEIVLKFKSPQK